MFYERSLSPDFTFADETIGTEIVGRDNEMDAVEIVFRHYRSVEYALYDSTREEISNGCLVVCGLVEMLITGGDSPGFSVSDKTCMTVCPGKG